MRLHRFFVSVTIGDSVSYILKDEILIKQWRNVFRYTTGSRVLLFDGTGAEYLALIESITPDRVQLQILERVETPTMEIEKEGEKSKKRPNIALFASMIKNNNFDLVLQKAVELGVYRIVPVVSDRTVKKELNIDRSKRILVEAAEQSGRRVVPTINEPEKLKEALDQFEGTIIVCASNGQPWKKVWTKKLQEETEIAFVIGPEGGWSPEELEFFNTKKYTHLGLGEHILRAETAAIAVLSLALMQ